MRLTTIDHRLFAAIADTGGITAAARRLGLPKSRVSRDLAAMEDRLGLRLVQRTTRRACLTEAGETLAQFSREVVARMDDAEAALEATGAAPRGDLRISAPFSVIRFLLAPRLGEFQARFPGIRLALDATMRVVDLIEEGIDVAIRIGELPPSSLVARQVAIAERVLMASPGYLARCGIPETPEALNAHSILALKRELDPQVWTLFDAAGERSCVTVRPSLALLDPGILMDLTVQDMGIATLPLIYARDALASGRLVRVLPGYRRDGAPIHVVYPSRRILAPKVRAFIDFTAAVFADAM